jgi:hypothetical protein
VGGSGRRGDIGIDADAPDEVVSGVHAVVDFDATGVPLPAAVTCVDANR